MWNIHTYTYIQHTYMYVWILAIKSCICDNMDEPRGYYAKWNESNRERQILYDFTYMWNLKKKKTQKTNEQT